MVAGRGLGQGLAGRGLRCLPVCGGGRGGLCRARVDQEGGWGCGGSWA